MSTINPPSAPEIAIKRRDLAPNQHAAFDALDKAIFADGALPAKTKQIIAVAVAHEDGFVKRVKSRVLIRR